MRTRGVEQGTHALGGPAATLLGGQRQQVEHIHAQHALHGGVPLLRYSGTARYKGGQGKWGEEAGQGERACMGTGGKNCSGMDRRCAIQAPHLLPLILPLLQPLAATSPVQAAQQHRHQAHTA